MDDMTHRLQQERKRRSGFHKEVAAKVGTTPLHFFRWQQIRSRIKRPHIVIASVVLLCLLVGSISLTTHLIQTNPKLHPTSRPTVPSAAVLQDPIQAPALSSPLLANDSNQWQADSSAGIPSCTFTASGYQFRSKGTNFCLANADAAIFDNFLYEIQVTLTHGSQAGIVFRSDLQGNGNFYYFLIDVSVKSFRLYMEGRQNVSVLVMSGLVPTIYGQGVPNELAVRAIGNTFTLYINQQQVGTVTDSTYRSGRIGVCVDTYADDAQSNVITAVFRNAKIWKL